MGEGDYRVFFLMSLLVVALFCSWGFGLAGGALSSLRGFGLVAGALDLWLGLCLLIGALDLWVGLRTRMGKGGLRPPFLLMSLLVVALFCSRALDL